MTAARAALLVAAALFGAAGCASAVGSLAPLEGLAPALTAGAAPVLATDVDRVLADADEAFARRPDRAAVTAARRAFLLAARADESRVEGLVGFVRATAWHLDHESVAARAGLVGEALTAARWCVRRAPDSAPCRYWLAIALGARARDNSLAARDAVARMVVELERAIRLDERHDAGGPRRILALVYVRAPGWPAGPGDAEAGLVEADRAVAIAPRYPPNVLALAEALEKNDRPREAIAAATRARDEARALAESGDPDATDWAAEAVRLLARLGVRSE